MTEPAPMRTAYLCDFDGTVSPHDIGAAFAGHFSNGEGGRVPELAEWIAGRIGHRVLTLAQCATVRVSESQALEFTRSFTIDPAFAPFVSAARARGDEVRVVSEGFAFYVRDQLARAGLGDLPWAANDLAFLPDRRIEPSFPFADPACDSCGNCKAQHVQHFHGRGFRTVLVGDGVSDRHGALAADHVLARGSLLEWCRAEGVPHSAVTDFAEVREWAARHEPAVRGPRS